MKRRFLAFLLVLCMAACIIPGGTAAAESQHMDFYFVSYEEGTYTVDREHGPWGGFGGSQGDVKYIQVFIGDPTDKPTYVTDYLTSGDTDIVTVEKISDNSDVYWKITFKSHDTTTLSYTNNGNTYIIDINPGSSGGNDGPGNDYEEPTEDGLYFRDVAWDQSGPTSDENGQKSKALTLQMGSSQPRDFVVLSSKTWSGPLALSDLECDGPIQLSKNGDAPIDIISTGVGEGHIWKNGNEEDKLTVTVTLPVHGLYSTAQISPSTLLDGIRYGDLNGDTKYIYLLTEGGYMAEDLQNLDIHYADNQWTQTGIASTETVSFGSGSAVKITLVDPGNDGYGLDIYLTRDGRKNNIVSAWISPGSSGGNDNPDPQDEAHQSKAVTVTVGDKNYLVGFGTKEGNDAGKIHISGRGTTYPDQTFVGEDEAKGFIRGSNPLTIMVSEDNLSGEYTELADYPFTVTVKSVAIDTYSGSAMKLSQEVGAQTPYHTLPANSDNLRAELSGLDFSQLTTHQMIDGQYFEHANSVWPYLEGGKAAEAVAVATLTIAPKSDAITVEGSSVSGEVDVTVRVHLQVTTSMRADWNRPDNDTVDALNAFLAEMAKSIDTTTDNHFELHLANTTYTGTVVIPEAFTMFGQHGQDLRIVGAENTTIVGGVNLNGVKLGGLNRIKFLPAANASEVVSGSRAVYGGSVNDLTDCEFRYYDVAIDSSAGTIHPHANNIFENNHIAVKVDIANSPDNSMATWYHNTYRKNTIAVQVISLQPNSFNPYQFRISDSNFFCNTTDFDIQYSGVYYFYRNYYYCEQDGIRNGILITSDENVIVHGLSGGSRSEEVRFDETDEVRNNVLVRAVKDGDNTVLNNQSSTLRFNEVYLVEDVSIKLVEDFGQGATLLATWSFGEGGDN